MRDYRAAVLFCLIGILTGCATGPTLHMREDLSSVLAHRPVVVHISSAQINLVNVMTYPDSLTGDIPRFQVSHEKTSAVHLYLADDFRIGPDAKRIVIPFEKIVRSRVTRRPVERTGNEIATVTVGAAILGALVLVVLLAWM